MTIDRDELVKALTRRANSVLTELNNYIDREKYKELETLLQKQTQEVLALF